MTVTIHDKRAPQRGAFSLSGQKEPAMADNGQVKVHPLRSFHEKGELVGPGGKPFSVDRNRANELKANGLVRFDSDKEEKASDAHLSFMQRTGLPNPEPPPEPFPGDPVTPAPGTGVPPVAEYVPPGPEGTTTPEPPPDTTFGEVSPPPGKGLPPGFGEVAEDPAERAAWKVRNNRSPDDPGAKEEDNYAIPLKALEVSPPKAQHAIVSDGGAERSSSVGVKSERAEAQTEAPKKRGPKPGSKRK